MKALVLSGGGSKGAAQLGTLRALLDANPDLDYELYAGISVGALNSSLLATGHLKETLPQLEDVWFNKVIGNRSIWRHHLWYYILFGICVIIFFIFAAFISFLLTAPKWLTIAFLILAVVSFYLPYYSLNNSHSIYNTDPLKDLVGEILDLDKLKNSSKKLIVGAVSFTTGNYKSVNKHSDDIKKWILASSAFPLFFPLQEIDGEYWTDGGILEISPLSDAIKAGATEIDVILTSPIEAGIFEGKPVILKQLQRHIDIMSSEILRNDLFARCSIVPDLKIRIFMPEKSLTSNSLDFSPDKIKRMYDEGKKMAEKVLDAEHSSPPKVARLEHDI